MKKRIAVKTAVPFQACVVGFGEQFVFSNGALLYKPRIDEIRILFLDGSTNEELHVDTVRLLEEAKHRVGYHAEHDPVVEPLHYAHGIATFVVEEEIADSSQAGWILITNIHQETILGKHSLVNGRCVFVRNTGDVLWLGERSAVFSETPQWRLRMLELSTRAWSPPKVLPASFAGKSLGQDVYFEIFNEFVYGVQSRIDEITGRTVHHVFRLSVQGGSRFDYGYFSIDHRNSHYDSRYNELKLVKDTSTGQIWVYEIRKEFLSKGYSERICHSYCINFMEAPISRKDTMDTGLEPLELIGAHQSHCVHRGECGLNIHESDPRRLLAYAYDTSTRTFLDIVKEPSPPELQPTISYLRSRSYADGSTRGWLFGGYSPQLSYPARIWPPTRPRGRQHSLLQTFMNPTGMVIHETWWSLWNGLLIFSPTSRDREGLRPIILLSFDPGLHIPGLRKSDGGLSSLGLENLAQLSESMATNISKWIFKVKPYHLLIRSLEEEHCRCYGLDLGYDRLNLHGN